MHELVMLGAVASALFAVCSAFLFLLVAGGGRAGQRRTGAGS